MSTLEIETPGGPLDSDADGGIGVSLTPQALRLLDDAELRLLADQLRQFLVSTLAATGGHLGSNLGVVELTLALHRVFDSPNDKIVWDTGHQAYVHKMVTGRLEQFSTLRQGGGMSGYPNQAESEHDLVENSHASTALSYAFGMASACRLNDGQSRVVAVVGDGALTGGVAYEALSNIGFSGMPVIIILNDNGRSYAPTISPLTTATAASCVSSSVSEPEFSELMSSGPAQFFESLGISYQGPIDGHDLGALEKALTDISGARGPVLLHVHTTKGQGYGPAEHDDEKCLHDIGPFEPDTGEPLIKGGSPLSYTKAFSAALIDEASRRPEVVAITAAMSGPTGLLGFRDQFPHRFFDVGIAEQHAVTAAAGMAMAGLRPVVAIYSTFLNRAWDQIYYDVGLHRLPVVFCLDRSGVTGDDGPSHHGLLDLALLTKVPGMTVLAPSSIEEVPVMLHQALEITSGPVAIRWPKTPGRSSDSVGGGLRARLVRIGADVCLLGVGKLLESCEAAAEILDRHGVMSTVWDVRVATPLDPSMIDDARRHCLVVVAEDGVAEGAVGSLVASAVAGAKGKGSPPPVTTCGAPVAYIPQGRPEDILAALGLDGPGIAGRVLDRLGASTAS